jgi:hypothetical protein
MMLWRFRRRVEAFGGDLSRWSADDRTAAEALLARSDRARAILASARRLDALLEQEAMPPVEEALAVRIVARAVALPQERDDATTQLRPDWRMPRVSWPQVAILAAAAVLGFIVGWTDVLPGASVDDFDLSEFVGVGFEIEDPPS